MTLIPRRRKKTPPRVGDAVWDQSRHTRENLQANGKIIRIDWLERVVIVHFYNDRGRKEFSVDELEGRWTDRFGGTWLLDEGAT